MARNGSGTYNLLTNSWNPATNGVSATATDWQNLINDVAAALTQSLSADGQTPMTGNLNAGNNKITGLAAGTSSGQSIRWEQVFTAPASFGGGAINVDASGNVGIGTNTPGTRLDVAGGCTSDFWRGRSNGSAPTADCAVYRPADNTLGFSTANTERVRVDASGNLLLTSATGVLGYGAGAGGTVTQSTSKSTAVTLNRPSGRITMNNAALAAGASVEFTFNNSLILQNDILLPILDGPSLSYRVEVARQPGGAPTIRLTNTSGTSVSEAVVINFAIIKGSTS